MELFPVFKDFDRDMLFVLVIKASQYYTEGSSSQLLLNFISVCYIVLGLIEVIGLIVIEAVVEHC